MADATITTVTRFVEEDGVRLNLTMEEAGILRVILHHIGGNPNETPRWAADSISQALSLVVEKPDDLWLAQRNHSIYFVKDRFDNDGKTTEA